MRLRPSRCRHPRLPFPLRSIDSEKAGASRIVFRALCLTFSLASTSGVAIADRAQTRSALIAMIAESKALSMACDEWVWNQARAIDAVVAFKISKEELVAEGLPITKRVSEKYDTIGRTAACRDAEERYGPKGEILPNLLERHQP